MTAHGRCASRHQPKRSICTPSLAAGARAGATPSRGAVSGGPPAYTHIHLHIYTHKHKVHTHACTCMYTYYTYMYVQRCAHPYIRAYIHAHTYIQYRRNRVNHWGGGVFLSKICTFAFKFLKFAHLLSNF